MASRLSIAAARPAPSRFWHPSRARRQATAAAAASRREQLAGMAASLAGMLGAGVCAPPPAAAAAAAAAATAPPAARLLEELLAAPPAWPASSAVAMPSYAAPGPCRPARLPRLEHTASRLYPACVDQRCLLRLQVCYPRGGRAAGLAPPYPLAILSPGFLIDSAELGRCGVREQRCVSVGVWLGGWGGPACMPAAQGLRAVVACRHPPHPTPCTHAAMLSAWRAGATRW